MERSVAPTNQIKFNDPYTQQLFPFNSTDGNVYLSRASNYLLNSVGNDVIISGFHLTNVTIVDSTTLELTLGPGLLIQDCTLVQIDSSTTLSLDLATFDSCFGKIVLYTDFQYIESIEANPLSFKLSYVTNDGLLTVPINDPWVWTRNRIYLNLFSFLITKNVASIKEITYPNFFYIGGKKYWRRGKANWVPADDTTATVSQSYFPLVHNLMSMKIFSQLYDSNLQQLTINNLNLPNNTTVKINIDEYKPWANFYSLVLHNLNDVSVYTVSKTDIDSQTYRYTLQHNIGQQYVMVQLYNINYELVRLHSITLVDENTLTLDFSSMYLDLADKYYVLITKNYLTHFNITNDEIVNNTRLVIYHNLDKKYVNSQLVNTESNQIVDSNTSIITLKDQNGLYLNTGNCIFPSGDYQLTVYGNTLDPIDFYNNEMTARSDYTYTRSFTVDDLTTTEISNFMTGELIVTHDLNAAFPIVLMYDSYRNVVQPDLVEILSVNSLKVAFFDISGLVGIHTVCIYNNENIVMPYNNTDLDANYDVQVDLTSQGLSNPIFQLYDSNNQLALPDDMEKVTDSIFKLNFDTQPEITNFNLVIAKTELSSYIATFDQTDIDPGTNTVNITHGLDTYYPLLQMYVNNYMFIPYRITVLDLNTITIAFDYIDLTVQQNFEIVILAGIPRIPNVFRYENAYYEEFSEINLIAGRKLIVNHNLNFMYPIVQIYDNNDISVSAQSIKINNANQIEVDFSNIVQELLTFYKVVVMTSKSINTIT